jgi:hypothetical protein
MLGVGLSLSGCAKQWPEQATRSVGVLPSSGTYILAQDDAPISDMEKMLQAQIVRAMPIKQAQDGAAADYIVLSTVARRPLKTVAQSGPVSASQPPLQAEPKRLFGCKRDVLEMGLVITNSANGEIFLIRRQHETLCRKNQGQKEALGMAEKLLQQP